MMATLICVIFPLAFLLSHAVDSSNNKFDVIFFVQGKKWHVYLYEEMLQLLLLVCLFKKIGPYLIVLIGRRIEGGDAASKIIIIGPSMASIPVDTMVKNRPNFVTKSPFKYQSSDHCWLI